MRDVKDVSSNGRPTAISTVVNIEFMATVGQIENGTICIATASGRISVRIRTCKESAQWWC